MTVQQALKKAEKLGHELRETGEKVAPYTCKKFGCHANILQHGGEYLGSALSHKCRNYIRPWAGGGK
jgi:hypothetical protein